MNKQYNTLTRIIKWFYYCNQQDGTKYDLHTLYVSGKCRKKVHIIFESPQYPMEKFYIYSMTYIYDIMSSCCYVSTL